MPREPPLAIPDGVYHVTNRGVDRGPAASHVERPFRRENSNS